MQSYEINMTLFFSHIKNEFDRSKMKECISMCRLNDIILYSSLTAYIGNILFHSYPFPCVSERLRWSDNENYLSEYIENTEFSHFASLAASIRNRNGHFQQCFIGQHHYRSIARISNELLFLIVKWLWRHPVCFQSQSQTVRIESRWANNCPFTFLSVGKAWHGSKTFSAIRFSVQVVNVPFNFIRSQILGHT